MSDLTIEYSDMLIKKHHYVDVVHVSNERMLFPVELSVTHFSWPITWTSDKRFSVESSPFLCVDGIKENRSTTHKLETSVFSLLGKHCFSLKISLIERRAMISTMLHLGIREDVRI